MTDEELLVALKRAVESSKKALERISSIEFRAVALELNDATDDLNDMIAEIETELRKRATHFAYVPIRPTGSSQTFTFNRSRHTREGCVASALFDRGVPSMIKTNT